MKKTVTARWSEHAVHLMKPLLEYTGPQLIEITFKMELISPFTVDPLGTIIMLEEIMDLAIPLPLIIGMKPMGRGLSLFVLTSLTHEMKYFYRGGGLLGASVDVQLKEYPTTFSISSLMQALGGVFGGAGAAGTDANAGALPSSLTSADTGNVQVGQLTQVDPQISQNAGNPVPSNIGFGAPTPSTPASPPSIPEAQSVTQGD